MSSNLALYQCGYIKDDEMVGRVTVFASGKYSSHPANNIERDTTEKLKPSYFNSGCCCFNDGDITGIEIEGGFIRLIKWLQQDNGPARMVLEEKKLEDILKDLD